VFHFDHGKHLALALHGSRNAQASLRYFLLSKTSQGLFDDLQRSSHEVDGITYTAILGALQQGGIAFTHFEVGGRHNQNSIGLFPIVVKEIFTDFRTLKTVVNCSPLIFSIKALSAGQQGQARLDRFVAQVKDGFLP